MTPNSKTVILAQNTNTSGVSTLTATVDTRGFSHVKIICLSSTSASAAVGTNNKVEDADASTGSWATFAGFVQGTDWTGSTATASTANAYVAYSIPLVGRKRYLKVTATQGAAAVSHVILAELSRAADAVGSASEAGANNGVGF